MFLFSVVVHSTFGKYSSSEKRLKIILLKSVQMLNAPYVIVVFNNPVLYPLGVTRLLLSEKRLYFRETRRLSLFLMSFLPSTKAMVGIAAVGGMFLGATGLTLHSRLQMKIKQHSYVRDSLKVLRQHEGAKFLLGTPIKDHNANLAKSEDNYRTNEEAKFKIAVTGSKGEGWLILSALRQNSLKEEDWSVRRCELEIVSTTELEPEKFANKRLVVFDTQRHGDIKQLLSGQPTQETQA